MTPDDSYEIPFPMENETDSSPLGDSNATTDQYEDMVDPSNANAGEADAELVEAKQAWDSDSVTDDQIDDPETVELAKPFVVSWNSLISTTNWEKGRIIAQWREALISNGASSTEYSDEAWVRRVGGVTAPHVGRLRRVFDRFGSTYESYEGLYWSHFLAALDWDDAPMWLEGAKHEDWSVSAMREKRWEATGAVESQRPNGSEVIEVDMDEDVVLPAQGGGRTREYGDDPDGVASGPRPEGPDFGDEEEFASLDGSPQPKGKLKEDDDDQPQVSIQPFAGLPELPDDLSDAIESLKLAVLRHKTSGWEQTDVETIQQYLDAVGVLLRS